MSDLLSTQAPAFDEVDPFLHLVLGVIATRHRADRVLETIARTPTARPDRVAEDDPLRDALLGLIAVRRRWVGVEAQLTSSPGDTPQDAPADDEPLPTDLLR